MSKGFSHDFSKVDPLPWQEAACNVTNEDLEDFFRALYDANEQWGADERDSMLAAVQAVVRLIRASRKDWRGRFSRPLLILHMELRNALKGKVSNALNSHGQAAGRGRRDAILHLQAASVHAANSLAGPKKVVLHKVAKVLQTFRFPREEFSKAPNVCDDIKSTAAKAERLTEKIKQWRKECARKSLPKKRNAPPKMKAYLQSFETNCVCTSASALDWLRSELEQAGFESVGDDLPLRFSSTGS